MKKNKKGFTLAELLVVIAIIAVLVVIAIPVFNNATKKAKQAADDANIRAAYAEYQMNKIDSDISSGSSITGTTIKFADGTSYDLQYYGSVTTGSGMWKGAGTKSN